MIIDVLLYIVGFFIQVFVFILPDWSLYPQTFLDGISFFGQKIAALNFFIFNVPQIIVIFLTIVGFEGAYYTVKKIVSVINFFRGSGKLEV